MGYSFRLRCNTWGNYWIRYTSNLTGATWAGSTDVTKTIPGSASSTSVSLMSGTYLIKAIDSSGNQSNNATLISSNTADILNLNNVFTTVQHPSFGTGTVCSTSDFPCPRQRILSPWKADFKFRS